MTNLEKRIEDIRFEADGIEESIVEGGTEGVYTTEELSKMEWKVDALRAYARDLEIHYI
tara:strand:+ start:1312 stop:1488 length:177 start_codon:yes stop_codon:yes gene_type:complete